MFTQNLSTQLFHCPSVCQGFAARELSQRIKEFSKNVFKYPEFFGDDSMDATGRSYQDQYVDYLTQVYEQRQEMVIDENGIAKIHIFGAMGLGLSRIERAFGCTDYLQLREDFQNALKQGAKGILLFGWSPGGGMLGSIETAEIISEVESEIPVYSYSDKGFYSAGFMLTCGASMCWGTKTGGYGNVGVIVDFWDTYEFYAKYGMYADPITNKGAELKDTFFKPSLTNEHREFIQSIVDEDATVFQDWVSQNRSLVDPEKVFKAGWFSGLKAIEHGLIDATGTINDCYDSLLGEILTGQLTNRG